MTKLRRGSGTGFLHTLVGRLRLGPTRNDAVTQEMTERVDIRAEKNPAARHFVREMPAVPQTSQESLNPPVEVPQVENKA